MEEIGLSTLWPVLLLVALGGLALLLVLVVRSQRRVRALQSEREALRGELEARRRELEEKTARLSAVHKVADALSEAVELPQLLSQALARAVAVLGLDEGEIHLINEDEEQVMQLGAAAGARLQARDGRCTIRVGECICGEAAAQAAPIVIDDATGDPRLVGRACGTGGIPSIASVPLRAKGGSLGVLTVRSCDPHHFALHDVELLTSVANFLAAAIENARVRSGMQIKIAELTDEIQQLAIVQERERIGREMHDGLAQTLGLLNVQIELVKGAMAAGDWPAAERELALLDSYVGNAYADVRQALDNLRRTRPKGETFLASLEEVLAEFGRRNRIETRLRTQNGHGPICFPPLVEVQLERVIQEALTNVSRHAEAKRVQVMITQNGAGWKVTIADDGIGFEVGEAEGQAGGYGLQTMRERVESLRGEFEVESEPGRGTRISVFVPCGGGPGVDRGSIAHPAG
jgi:two-component system nitrate/nitrite sensor histidine kinase NarX